MKIYTTKIATICSILIVVSIFSTTDIFASAANDQLLINRSTLTSGSDDSIREVAARQLLIDQDPAARDILIEILRDYKNDKAILAVCNAIGISPDWEVGVPYEDDYIKPLLDVVVNTEGDVSAGAAEALALYPYEKIKVDVENILFDDEADQKARLNVIYAVGLRLSEKEAIAEIIALLDDKDPVIADKAGKTLQSWVPMGSNKELWNYVRSELKQKNPDEILRNRLASQEQRVQKLSRENKILTDEIVNVYEQLYQLKTEADARSAFLVEATKKDIAQVRMWAVKKIASWRNSSDLPMELKEAVVAIISDGDADVRLEVANLIVYMADANPSNGLMEQLKVEQNPAVELALLEALGESCYYAMLPSASIQLDEQVRVFTLEKAKEFVADKIAERAIAGADVIRKLLEKNGLEDAVAEGYINDVKTRYKQALTESPQLAVRLLEISNRFCQQGFHYRALAAKIFAPEFESAINSSNEVGIRKAAAQGLIYIDRTEAFNKFTDKQLYNDSEPAIVNIVINLAKDVGNGKDCDWLLEKVGQNSDTAWQAIVAILQREDEKVLRKVLAAVSDDAKKIEVYEIGRKKAGLQYKTTIELAHFYLERDKPAQAAELYQWLLADAAGKSEAIADAHNAIKAFAAAGQKDMVAVVVKDVLAANDITPESDIAKQLNALTSTDDKVLKESLIKISIPDDLPREGWQKLISSWLPEKETQS